MRVRSLVLLPLLFTVAVVAGEHSPAEAIVPLSNGETNYTVAVISYSQETCTFCPGGDTEIKDRAWRVPFITGEKLIDRKRGFIGGFVHAAKALPDFAVIGINSPDEVFGGSSRSWESKESFDEDHH